MMSWWKIVPMLAIKETNKNDMKIMIWMKRKEWYESWEGDDLVCGVLTFLLGLEEDVGSCEKEKCKGCPWARCV